MAHVSDERQDDIAWLRNRIQEYYNLLRLIDDERATKAINSAIQEAQERLATLERDTST